jgi:ADP-ribose pyrophosphatase
LNNERTIARRRIFDGRILKLELYEVMLDNGKIAERELITHQGGVGVLPVTDTGEVILVKQFRKPYEAEIIEIPAGKKEPGEEPESCAVRELEEETGIRAEKLTFLADMYPSPGYTDEIVHIYKAEGLTYGEMSADEDEFIEVVKYPMADAMKMITGGLIKDAKTIIAILMAAKELNK